MSIGLHFHSGELKTEQLRSKGRGWAVQRIIEVPTVIRGVNAGVVGGGEIDGHLKGGGGRGAGVNNLHLTLERSHSYHHCADGIHTLQGCRYNGEILF